MLGTELILFPDAGPGFTESLRTSVLFCDRTRVFTLLDPDLAARLLDFMGPVTPTDHRLPRRIASYFRFVCDHAAELTLLKDEGLITPIVFDQPESWDDLEDASAVAAARLTPILSPMLGPDLTMDSLEAIEALSAVQEAYETLLPCASDLNYVGLALQNSQAGGPLRGVLEGVEPEAAARLLLLRYILAVIVLSERSGLVTISWSPPFQRAMALVRSAFAGDLAENALGNRARIQKQLFRSVLKRYLPRVDDLPITEVLAIRRRCEDELRSLRVALAALGTQVDPTAELQEIELAIHDIVASRVDPAVDELRRSLASARLAAIKSIGRSVTSAASATFLASLALAAGAPLDLAAATGAIGGMVGSLVDSELARRAAFKASQWSLLLRFSRPVR